MNYHIIVLVYRHNVLRTDGNIYACMAQSTCSKIIIQTLAKLAQLNACMLRVAHRWRVTKNVDSLIAFAPHFSHSQEWMKSGQC